MLDLIERQAAIDALNALEKDGHAYVNGAFFETILRDEVKRVLEELPSALPEITMEDIEEYCRKRCLIVITNELFHEMRARWSQSQPEIIRCKDCKWGDWYTASSGKRYCYCMETGNGGRTEDDYCSYAERITNGKAD